MSPDNQDPLDSATKEMRQASARIREKYDLDSVVMVATKQTSTPEGDSTEILYGLSGNQFAAKHAARGYSEL